MKTFVTGEITYVELADSTVRKVPVCNIYVDCLFYKGRTRAICFKNPVATNNEPEVMSRNSSVSYVIKKELLYRV